MNILGGVATVVIVSSCTGVNVGAVRGMTYGDEVDGSKEMGVALSACCNCCGVIETGVTVGVDKETGGGVAMGTGAAGEAKGATNCNGMV